MNCVQAAIKSANKEENGGQGYDLLLTLENGATIEGTPHHPETAGDGYLEIHVGEDAETAAEVFVEVKRVVCATIIWG